MDLGFVKIDVAALPTVNACLNVTSTILLLIGYWLIRSGQRRSGRRSAISFQHSDLGGARLAPHELAHKRVMLAAFGVSVLFLISYLVYHYHALHKPFAGPSGLRPIYYTILISHILLAATVPFLASTTIWLGLTNRRAAHRRLARWTFPIWLYVSVTGVIVYWMLYRI